MDWSPPMIMCLWHPFFFFAATHIGLVTFPRGEKSGWIGPVTQVVRVPPRDRESQYCSWMMPMDHRFCFGIFSWLLRSFWAGCWLKVHWILVLLCIRIWQATASTHGKTPAREPFPSNVGLLPQEESGGLCCSCTMHFLEGNRLFPHLFTDSLTPGLCLCVSLVNILHSNNFFW